MVNRLLAPYRSKSLVDPKSGREKVKLSAVDLLSNEQKVARGKFALAQIIKKINALYPEAKNKWTGKPDGKAWVDSKGVGIYIIPAGSQREKLVIYADGTLKTYENSNLISTEKLTNKTVDIVNGNWWINNRIVSL
jgi:hypothetical protein